MIYVFFATTGWDLNRCSTIKGKWRVVRRFPAKTYWWFLGFLIRVVTRSPLVHCAAGMGGRVIDPHIQGDSSWKISPYILKYPRLTHFYVITSDRSSDFAYHAERRPKPIWPTILRWLTGGRYLTTDCVCTVVRTLRGAGIDCPRRIYSPKQLDRWLKEQGYVSVDLSGRSAINDSGTGYAS